MPGRIVIADDIAANRIVLKSRIESAFYKVTAVDSAQACLMAVRQGRPDVVIVDFALRDLCGPSLVSAIRAAAGTADIPVIALADRPDPVMRLAALRAGAEELWPKSVPVATLLARLRSLMRARAQRSELLPRGMNEAPLGLAEPPAAFDHAGEVALVSLRREAGVTLRQKLEPWMRGGLRLLPREDLMAELSGAAPGARGQRFDALLLDLNAASEAEGRHLVSEISSRRGGGRLPVCVIVPPQSGEVAPLYDRGADEVVEGPVTVEELALRLGRLAAAKRAMDRLRASVADGLRLSVIDPLTGLHNRRYALHRLSQIAERAAEAQQDFAVMLVDMDRFKTVNDRWGHAAGDAVLVDVAERLRTNLRGGDLLARIGGEEFLVGLPETGPAEARALAERLCQAVERQPVALPNGLSIRVTASIGLAISHKGAMPVPDEPVSALVDRADQALLESKSAGRNRITISQPAA